VRRVDGLQMFNRSADPQFIIIVWEKGSRSITLGENDAIHARLSFECLVDRYYVLSVDCRVELYDGPDLAEDWLSGERASHHQTARRYVHDRAQRDLACALGRRR
jgi:hypothetical protein